MQERADAAAREHRHAKAAIASVAAETARYGRELGATEKTASLENDRLAELQRHTAGCGLALRQLEAECRRRAEVMAAAGRKDADRLAWLQRSADEACERLAEARAKAVAIKARCELAVENRRRLQEAVVEETCRARTRLEWLAAEKDRLAARLADATAEADAAQRERARLTADAGRQADRLARLTDEVGLMERRACHAQSLLSVHRGQSAAETTLLGDLNAVQRHGLTVLQADLRDLRAAVGHCSKRTVLAATAEPPGTPDGDPSGCCEATAS